MKLREQRPIGMASGNNLAWDRYDALDLQGTLLVSPHADPEVIGILEDCAPRTELLLPGAADDTDGPYSWVGAGAQGAVYRVGKYAVKRFRDQHWNPKSVQRPQNYYNLLANIALELAVKAMNDKSLSEHHHDGFTYATPLHLAAFVPSSTSAPTIRPCWVMSYEEPTTEPERLPPTIMERVRGNRDHLAAFLLQGLVLIGAPREDIYLGDTISTPHPLIRYSQPPPLSIIDRIRRKDPLLDVGCEIILHDARTAVENPTYRLG